MLQGIQNLMAEIGEAGCYALCLVHVAEEYLGMDLPAVDSILKGIEKGYIQYNWSNPNDNDNMTVLDPAKFVQLLTKREGWYVTKEAPDYKTQTKNTLDYIIQRWERKSTGKTIGHFRMPNWEPYNNSLTVKNGQIVSLRVLHCPKT